MRKKVSIVGAGNVGATAAHEKSRQRGPLESRHRSANAVSVIASASLPWL